MSTESHEIAVKSRSEFGTGAARRARKAGMIPAVIYSKGKAAEAVYVENGEWEAISQHNFNLLQLVDGDRKMAALVKEVQTNFLKGHVVHIDFQEVNLNEEIHAEVAIHVFGNCAGVNHGGVLEQDIHMLHVVCKAMDLPESVTVDVSNLEIGDMIELKDLVLPEGVKAVGAEDEVVVHVIHEMAEEPVAAPAVAEGAGTEPEVIAKGKGEEGDDAAAKDAKK